MGLVSSHCKQRGIIASLWNNLKNNGLGHDWYVKANTPSQFLQRKGRSCREVVRRPQVEGIQPVPGTHRTPVNGCLFLPGLAPLRTGSVLAGSRGH